MAPQGQSKVDHEWVLNGDFFQLTFFSCNMDAPLVRDGHRIQIEALATLIPYYVQRSNEYMFHYQSEYSCAH